MNKQEEKEKFANSLGLYLNNPKASERKA